MLPLARELGAQSRKRRGATPPRSASLRLAAALAVQDSGADRAGRGAQHGLEVHRAIHARALAAAGAGRAYAAQWRAFCERTGRRSCAAADEDDEADLAAFHLQVLRNGARFRADAAAGGERLARWPAGSQHPAHGVLAAAGGLERAVEAVTGADWEAAFFDPAPSEAAGGIAWDDPDGAIDAPAAAPPPGR